LSRPPTDIGYSYFTQIQFFPSAVVTNGKVQA